MIWLKSIKLPSMVQAPYHAPANAGVLAMQRDILDMLYSNLIAVFPYNIAQEGFLIAG